MVKPNSVTPLSSRLKNQGIFLVPFATLFLAFLWPILLLKDGFVLGDYSVQHLPWASFFYDSLRAGTLPYWTDLMACGFPLVAEGQVGAFYLPNLLMYRALPFLAAYNWSIALHLFIGGVGMYVYVRHLGVSRTASTVASLCFSFGSGFGGLFYNTGSLRVLTWLPLVLYILERIRFASSSAKILGILLMAFLFSQQWTGGFSQLALYSFLYLVLYEVWASCEKEPRLKKSKRLLSLFCLFAALGLGTLLAFPQVLSTLELIPRSVRADQTAAFALWGSVHPAGGASLFFPHWGNALRISFYVGILPLFFVLGCFFLPARKGLWRHVFLAMFFFLLALGQYNPLYKYFIETFSFTFLRNPAKFLFFSGLSLAVLAAYGYENIIAIASKRQVAARYQKACWWMASLAVLLPLLGWLTFQGGRPLWTAMGERHVLDLIAAKGTEAKEPAYYFGVLDSFFERLGGLFSYRNPFNLKSIVLAAVSGTVVSLFLKARLGLRKFSLGVLAILVVDLYIFGRFMGIGFMGNAAPFATLSQPSSLDFVRSELKGGGKLVEFVGEGNQEDFTPNRNMLYGVSHAGGYSPLLLGRYYELVKDLGFVDASLGRKAYSREAWRKQRRILDLVGVSLIKSDTPLKLDDLELRRREGDFFLYRNKTALPKVAGFYQWKMIEDKNERLAYMKSSRFDPSRTLIAEDPAVLPPEAGRNIPYTAVRSLKDGGTEISAQIEMERDGLALVRVAAYPGWQAEVDGEIAPHFIVNHAFIGFFVSEGLHTLRIAYRPTVFGLSFAASGLAYLAILSLVGAVLVKGVRLARKKSRA